jgi:hypothetical protein
MKNKNLLEINIYNVARALFHKNHSRVSFSCFLVTTAMIENTYWTHACSPELYPTEAYFISAYIPPVTSSTITPPQPKERRREAF